MNKKRKGPVYDAELRRRAEKSMAERMKKTPSHLATKTDSRRLVQELEVHQIELELQNEELQRVQNELEASHAKYFDLYERAPIGFLTLSEDGRILEANLTAANLLGVAKDQLINKWVTRFITREHQDIYYLHCQKLFETRAPQTCVLKMIRKGDHPFWVQFDAILASDAAGGSLLCHVGMSDITALKQLEEEMSCAKKSVEEANQKLRRMYSREQRFARIDGLTGLNNRRYWFELAGHQYKVATRYRHPLSVILFDIDHFKLVNDRFGHEVGDQMLEHVAKAAGTALRSADMIGRYGGEEFVIALPMTTSRQAYAVAERIRAGVAAIRISTPKGVAAVTLSLGINEMMHAPPGEHPDGDDSIMHIINSADKAMYKAKRAGGNRIATWSELSEYA
ncbi:MAG: sensor domain-containing diguanylate cyclase [Candidatus Eisenbacteria bacterium]|uniref:Sensor domain-containing diguanylate cyclase n=1 Tax=Eiseniibacteriota bacterium TaxID=2212470 RepID=A0A948S0K3_UNCEI|nr:sensor domain-containing diguanylate cyclase [Candidatus Eisenbacteria bacterium]MBU2693376.1 sensor domain-containing diguanylate cyclase [Candidatus Eisenbacteria bacterium]